MQSIALAGAGDFESSLQCASEAVRLESGNVEYRLQMARALLALDVPEDALHVLRDAIPLDSKTDLLLKEIGDLHLHLGDYAAATRVADELAAVGNELEAQLLRARAAFRDQQWETAYRCFQAAQSIEPRDYRGINGMGTVLLCTGSTGAAQKCFEAARQLAPTAYEPMNNLGLTLEREGKLTEAAESYEMAFQLNPRATQARFNAALTWLKLGELARGWNAYEIRFKVPELKPMLPNLDEARLWDGRNPQGLDLLVLGEQGFGDQIQFARYLPLLAARGAHVHFACAPELLGLFETLAGDIDLIPMGNAPPAHDWQCGLMSLPGIMGTTMGTIPADIPYLAADPAKLEYWRRRIGADDRLKVGLVWCSSNPYEPYKLKNIPLAVFEPIWSQPHIRCFSLQMERSSDEQLPQEVVDLAEDIHDFSDTAAALMALDVLVSIDTAAAHLAGALGRRVFLLAKPDADWRWFTESEDSPWYPTMRIFRKARDSDWDSLVAKLAQSIGN
jgi:tetratricopeptide (TPR) repeat protein